MPQRSYAHAAALGAIAAVCLAGCSAGADVDPERFEVAIRSHAVANLAPYGTVTDVDCRPADPGNGSDPIVADVVCTFRTAGARWPSWASCSDEEVLDQLLCFGEDPPVGDPVFERRDWRGAPKSVTWKCEDVDEAGRDIGPVFVALRDDHSAPVRGLEWRTKDRAEDVARSYGATLYVDC